MKYHNFAQISFAIACAFLLEGLLGIGGDLIYNHTEPQVQGYVFKPVPATVHKYVRRT